MITEISQVRRHFPPPVRTFRPFAAPRLWRPTPRPLLLRNSLLLAPSLVAHTTIPGAVNGGTSAAIDTTGATILIIGASFQNGVTPTISDIKGNAWTGLTAQSSSSPAFRLYYVANPTVGSGHTFTFSGTSIFSAAMIAAFSGVKATSPFDAENGVQTSFVGTLAIGSVTPANANSLMVAGATYNGGTATGFSAGFTTTDTPIAFGTGVNYGCALAWNIVTGATNPQVTVSPVSPLFAAADAAFIPVLTPASSNFFFAA